MKKRTPPMLTVIACVSAALFVAGLYLLMPTLGHSQDTAGESTVSHVYATGSLSSLASRGAKYQWSIINDASSSVLVKGNYGMITDDQRGVVHIYFSDESVKKRTPRSYIDEKYMSAVPDGIHTGDVLAGGVEWSRASGGESDFVVARATGTPYLMVLEAKKSAADMLSSVMHSIAITPLSTSTVNK